MELKEKITLDTVSYTHLDVYKRQIIHLFYTKINTKIERIRLYTNLIYCTKQKSRGSVPVSYTHLIGTYITIELPSLTDNFTETDKRLETVGNEIKRLFVVQLIKLLSLCPLNKNRVAKMVHIPLNSCLLYTSIFAHMKILKKEYK